MTTGTVRFKLVSLDEVELRPGDTLQVARHRLIMLVYLIVVAILVVLNVNGTTRELPLELRAPVYIVGALVGTLTIIGVLLLAEAGAKRGRDVLVPASPVFFICALFALASGEGLSMLVVAGPPMNFVEGLLLVLFYYILTEIIVGLTVHYIFPTVLAEIRADHGGIEPFLGNDPVAASATPAPSFTALAPGGTVVPLRRTLPVRIGNRHFDAAQIIRIEAEGNYVRVVTQNERQLLPGPFSAVVAQMPPTLGRQISRSGWVATLAVVDQRRVGRDILLRLTDGEELRISTARQDQLRDWIDSLRAAAQQASR